MSAVQAWQPEAYTSSDRKKRTVHRSQAATYVTRGSSKIRQRPVPEAPTILVDFGKTARVVAASMRKAHVEWRGASAPGFLYARSQLRHLEAEHGELGLTPATKAAKARMLRVLRDVLAEDSVYPTLSIDEDGGVLAEWSGAGRVLEVECDAEGTMTFSFRRRGEGTRVRGGSTTHLRRLIRDFSAFVESANPNWRALFATHSHQAR